MLAEQERAAIADNEFKQAIGRGRDVWRLTSDTSLTIVSLSTTPSQIPLDKFPTWEDIQDILVPQIGGLLGIAPLSVPIWFETKLAPMFSSKKQAINALKSLSPSANKKGEDTRICSAVRQWLINSVYCLEIMLGAWKYGQELPEAPTWELYKVRNRTSQKIVPLWLINSSKIPDVEKALTFMLGTDVLGIEKCETVRATLSPEQMSALNRLHLGAVPDISQIQRRKQMLEGQSINAEKELLGMVHGGNSHATYV